MCVNNRQKASILKGFGFGGKVLSKPNQDDGGLLLEKAPLRECILDSGYRPISEA
jgi:hypothetical protein